MASLIDKATLAADATFTARVKAAMVEKAAQVLAGPKADDQEGAASASLAARVLHDPDGTAPLFVMAVAVDDAVADAGKANTVTDAAVRARVGVVWPFLANG